MSGKVPLQRDVVCGRGERPILLVRQWVLWLAGVLGIVMAAGTASPQGNIDAGKTPAQMFADTCSNCHRRPQELKRASVGFLRQHYTPGAQEAAAMASYLAGVPADPRGGKDRGKQAPPEKDKARPHQQAQDRNQERPKVQQLPKAKRAAEIAKSAAAEVPPEAPPEPIPEATPVPKLEPFEE